MTDDEVNALISEVDQNQDGLIDYKEFLEMMMAKKKKDWAAEASLKQNFWTHRQFRMSALLN